MRKRDQTLSDERELDLVQRVFSGEGGWCVDDAYRRYLDLGGQLEEPEFVDKIRDWYLKVYENGNH